MRFISLFSGVGGFDLGFERAGMECVAQVEFNKQAADALKYHWGKVPHYEDVRHVGKANLPAADLICGGFPCQDVSVAGKRTGLAGKRSGLWFEFHRIITECNPGWVVIENVPGLLSSNDGRDFAVLLAGLTGIIPSIPVGGWKNSGFARGYKHLYRVGWRMLDAQYDGLAQRRKRVFIIANLAAALGNPTQVLFERESSAWDTPPSRETRQGNPTYSIKGAAIGRKPENGPQYGEISEDGTCYTLNTSEVHAVAGTLSASGAGTARTGNARNETSFLVPTAVDARNDRIREWVETDDRIRAVQSDAKASTAQEHVYYKTNAVVNSLDVARVPQILPDITYGLRTDITPKWLENIAPTLLTPSPSGGGHPPEVANLNGVRRLTPTECERLQGFPDGWTAVNGASDSTRYKQLGNAIAVPVAEWIGKRIMQAIPKAIVVYVPKAA